MLKKSHSDSLERNDGNQFPVQLRIVSVGIHRHRFVVDSMKRRITDSMHMFLHFGYRPASFRTWGAIEYCLGLWWVLVHSPHVYLQVRTLAESLGTVKTPVGGLTRVSAH